jgi:hypothetical protein
MITITEVTFRGFHCKQNVEACTTTDGSLLLLALVLKRTNTSEVIKQKSSDRLFERTLENKHLALTDKKVKSTYLTYLTLKTVYF